MLGLKLNHVSKRGHLCRQIIGSYGTEYVECKDTCLTVENISITLVNAALRNKENKTTFIMTPNEIEHE